MTNAYLNDILEISEMATKQWDEFATNCKEIDVFKKLFHLRPTSSGVTIVSTLENKPMRGKKVGKTVVKKWLNELNEIVMSLKTDEEKLDMLTKLKFEDRKKNPNIIKEEYYQAKMIGGMANNQSLKDFLGVNELYFIASEFIYHKKEDSTKKLRVDIIAYNGIDKLYFFELKEPNNKTDDPIKQLENYIYEYGKANRADVVNILKKYPINRLKNNDFTFEGYAVYGYSEKLDLSKSKKVGILSENIGEIRFL